MRFVALMSLLAFLARAGLAQEEEKPQLDEDLVKDVRAMVSAKRDAERDEIKAKILARTDVDWPSLKEGLMKGRYYQKPLVTAYGERHSGKHLGVRHTGADGKERGFSFFVPKDYDAEKPFPLVVYLHHGSEAEHIGRGMDSAAVAVTKFKKVADEYGFFFLAPYTNKGAEWWTPNGEDLVAWSIAELKKQYNIDENRITLMGALDGADATWYLAQAMPGTFSAVMPMTGDPYEITGMVRPLCLGTLDRMDFFLGIPGKTKSTVGEKNIMQFFDGLQPMFHQGMRITTAVFPRSDGDFHYLEDIEERLANFAIERRRKPLAVEVDVETTLPDGLRSLWLVNHGWDKDGDVAQRLPSTVLKWERKLPGDPEKRIGVSAENRKWEIGVVINRATGAAQENNLFPGDVILEVDGQPIKDIKEIGPLVQKHEWDDEVHLLLAREVKEDDLEREQRNQRIYMKVRAKIEQLRKEGKQIPSMRDLRSMVMDEETDAADSGDEGEDEDVEIEIGNGPGPGKKPGPGARKDDGHGGGRAKTTIFVFERWLRLRKPGVVLVYAGFGLNQDNSYGHAGVRISGVYPGSLADRAGFKPGDVIKQIGDTEVKNSHDIQKWIKSTNFKFEDEPAGENWVDFTVQAYNNDQWGPERTVRVTWEPIQASRVDAHWDKKDDTCNVLVRNSKGFTLYFTDELMPPNKDFYLFINDVPYQDLVNPAGAPKYPRMSRFSDGSTGDRLYRMRRERARVAGGWKPDAKVAIEDFLANEDREMVVGAKMDIDLTKFHDAFKEARKHSPHGERPDKGERVKKAYEEHKNQG